MCVCVCVTERGGRGGGKEREGCDMQSDFCRYGGWRVGRSFGFG